MNSPLGHELRDTLVDVAVMRVVRERREAGLDQSWSDHQLAAATGLPTALTAASSARLQEKGRLFDTRGVRFGTLRVRSVDPEWERAVWELVKGRGDA